MCSVFKSAELSNYLLQNQEFTANSYEKTHGSSKVWLSRRLRGDAMETISQKSSQCKLCGMLVVNYECHYLTHDNRARYTEHSRCSAVSAVAS